MSGFQSFEETGVNIITYQKKSGDLKQFKFQENNKKRVFINYEVRCDRYLEF